MENKILVIDQTIREGMQHKGIVFSYSQREKILEFQNKLNINICQAGYAPAHETEAENLKKLHHFAVSSGIDTAIAGMGRALKKDAEILIKTGVSHFHLHFQIKENSDKKSIFKTLSECAAHIRDHTEKSNISIAMLDIGKSSDSLMKAVVKFLSLDLNIDIISLPDTSGTMAPNKMFEKIKKAKKITGRSGTKISIHCHNDMGMANANTVMGICAGAEAIETSVMGIGERNGIADLYVTAKTLKDQGYKLNVSTDDIETFKEYYHYIDSIYEAQTGNNLLTYNTPVFGEGVKSHVAGTHIDPGKPSQFGLYSEEKYYINLLCGNHLVEKFLEQENISFNKNFLTEITSQIKSQSAKLERRLYKKEIVKIADMFNS